MAKYVLFVLRTKAALLENFPIVDALKAHGVYEPIFLVDPGMVREHVPMIHERGYKAVHPSGKEIKSVPPLMTAEHTLAPSAPSLKERVFGMLPNVVRQYLHFRSRLKRVRTFLASFKPAVIVLSGDRQLGWEIACIKAGNELMIPTLITPYAIQFAESIAECRMRRDDYAKRFRVHGIVGNIGAFLFPGWVIRYRNERMFYYPFSDCLAAHLLGLMPRNPWTIGGGNATHMAVESEYARSIFLADGVSDSRMTVTGKPCNDDLSHSLDAVHRSTVRKEHGIAEDATVLLCSLPQLGEHGLIPWSEHWKDIEWLLSTFASLPNITTLISLHPKSDHAAYASYLQKYGAILGTRRIYELLPACDLFVAAVSSTVTQAIAAHKPCVVEDIRGLDHRGYYDSAPGVTVLRTHEAFKPAIERLLTDRNFYDQQVRDQETNGSAWALMDGKCTERVVGVIEGLAE